ncbi:MAG: hypothetical protein IPM35_10750 [Myxococcales bacterium]|nr:hypothetical protein [Myxococcales bacterium]
MKPALAGGLCLLALLACKQGESGSNAEKPATTAATAAPAASTPPTPRAPAVEAPEEKTKASPRKLGEDELATLKKSMASGTKVIAEQSFLVELGGIGECSFVSALAPNERELVFFVFRNGKVYQGLVTSEKLKSWTPRTVNAVTFRDVDGDGLEDIVVVAEYLAAKQKTFAAIVFMRRGANFKLDEARSDKASAAGNDVVRAAQLAR